MLYVYLASFSHGIFDIFSHPQISTQYFPHLMSDQMSSSPCWMSRVFTFATAAVVRFGRLSLNSSTFEFNFVSVFRPLGTITVLVVLDNFFLFLIELLWWCYLSQIITFLQWPTSNVLNFYFFLWLSLCHQSECLHIYLYDLDCVVLWALPGTSDEISTLLLYILTHIFTPF